MINVQLVQSTAVAHKFTVNGISFEVFDSDASEAAQCVFEELTKDTYGLEEISFCAGDVVVDIGGHIGMFAIYLGLRFPEIMIHSFEPFRYNFELFSANIKANAIGNIKLHQLAISGDGRKLEMVTNPTNSGAATCCSRTLSFRRLIDIQSKTLDDIFSELGIEKCKLLKIDCEGMEHEILTSTTVWNRIEHLRAEFHINTHLSDKGCSIIALAHHCRQHLSDRQIWIKACAMSE
jgi:FkbM family methyltransferase